MLTNNGKRPIRVPSSLWPSGWFVIELADGQGRRRKLTCPILPDGPAAFTSLSPKGTLRGWIHYTADYPGLGEEGEFTVLVTCKVLCAYGNDQPALVDLRSDEIRLKVAAPKGEDAKAADIITRRMSRRALNPKDPDYGLVGHLVYSDTDLRKEILAQTKSSRFHATALLHNVMDCLLYYNRPRIAHHYKSAKRDAHACIASESSPYMKGLVRYFVLMCAEEAKVDVAERRMLAEQLLAEHPGTYMADMARAALEELKAPKK